MERGRGFRTIRYQKVIANHIYGSNSEHCDGANLELWSRIRKINVTQ